MLNDLVDGYQQGKTTTELAKEYNISKATICRGLRKRGIEPERKDDKFTIKEIVQEDKDAILSDFKLGFNIKALSNKYDYSYTRIVRLLEENDLWTKKTIDKSIDDETKVIKMNENNVRRILSNIEQLEVCEKFINGPLTRLELATEYQVHPDTVSAILRRHDSLVKRYIADEVVDMLCDEYKEGVSIYKLSGTYNQSPETIKYWLTKRQLLDIIGEEGASEGPKKKWTTLELREKAKEDTPEMYEILKDIARDPTSGTRNRITAASIVVERGHGKAREEVEEEKDNQSATNKIMSRLPDSLKIGLQKK